MIGNIILAAFLVTPVLLAYLVGREWIANATYDGFDD